MFFIDVGVRNAVIDELEDIEHRQDKGSVFENFFFLELLKNGSLETFPPTIYFWRTTDKLEIDFIQSQNNKIKAFECKWTYENIPFTKFLKNYPNATTMIVSPETLLTTKAN